MDGNDVGHALAQFVSETGEPLATPFDLPLNVTTEQLQLLCNSLLKGKGDAGDVDDVIPYSFFIGDTPITRDLASVVEQQGVSTETLIAITYQPQAVFRVRAVTRCSSTIEGHAEAVISVAFSPSGAQLASGSGDTTVRLWDLSTETPLHTCEGHKNWVLCVAWSPCGKRLASADKTGVICLWEPATGKQLGKPLVGHRMWVNSLSWEPLHVSGESRRLASGSKDTTVRVWDVVLGQTLLILSSHTHSVTCVRWGGLGLLYTASQDRSVKVWRGEDGALCRTLAGHAHWVNILALSTDYVIRTGAFDPVNASINPEEVSGRPEELQSLAKKRFDAVVSSQAEATELLISGSDDFTMFLWKPSVEKKPVARMTGHQQLINDVKFSPDGRLIASASFDKSVKLWAGVTGKFVCSLRGHVQAVYQVCWSSDSRLLCSASADSTLKLWHVKTGKILHDLPGHSDEVYAIDWSPDGQRVASGGKDRVLKIWRQ